ncbi:MAG: EAL domain-containing protein [Pararobbsia sp.]
MALGLITQFPRNGRAGAPRRLRHGLLLAVAARAVFPLDMIKLDRSFVRGINTNAKSQALVRSMVAVAQALNFAVVAKASKPRPRKNSSRRSGSTTCRLPLCEADDGRGIRDLDGRKAKAQADRLSPLRPATP